MRSPIISLLLSMILLVPQAFAGTYPLEIAEKLIKVDGEVTSKLTINGVTPGPTLRFKEGEDVTVMVTNRLKEDSSIHWHGLLLPPEMDGVPGLSRFPGIKPGETFIYKFTPRQSGTYWYHAHSKAQEQDGLIGSIVIAPKGSDPIRSDRDYVVLLSDETKEPGLSILAHLKMDAGYYSYAKRTIVDFWSKVRKEGFMSAWNDFSAWEAQRMSPTDLADVSGYTFMFNGKSSKENWTGVFKPGERVRLRFINASAMSLYDISIPGLRMSVVQSDGQIIEPITVDEFRFGAGETYDVIVTPTAAKAYSIVAEPIDRTGVALGTLAPKDGMKGDVPRLRKRSLLTMEDMNMEAMKPMSGDHATMRHGGWADADTPPGHRALSYKDLRYSGVQKDLREPVRDIRLTLGGNMERYIWTINGQKVEDAEPIRLAYHERVRLTFVNQTMMAHPMHLHGMFVQLDNGQPARKRPNKHTITVPPGKTISVLLTADEPGEWAFHCHLIYHMLSGMMTTVIVEKPSAIGNNERGSDEQP